MEGLRDAYRLLLRSSVPLVLDHLALDRGSGTPARCGGALARFYSELGTRIHVAHIAVDDIGVEEVLQAAGLPRRHAAAAADATWDAVVAASMVKARHLARDDASRPLQSASRPEPAEQSASVAQTGGPHAAHFGRKGGSRRAALYSKWLSPPDAAHLLLTVTLFSLDPPMWWLGCRLRYTE